MSTSYDRPAFVMMSIETYDRLRGAVTVAATVEALPDDVVARLQRLAEQCPEDDVELVGDLSGAD